MKKIFKILLLVLMLMGIIFSIIDVISAGNMAVPRYEECTVQPDGCYGAGLNC